MAGPTDLEGFSPTTSSAIRKSCYFCRSRKIRCTGGQVCAACRARNLGCVYGREAIKGRPKGTKSGSAPRKGPLQNVLNTAASPGCVPAQMDNEEHRLSSLINFPLHQPSSRPWPTPVRGDFSNSPHESMDVGHLLFGAALEYVFQREFRESSTPVETAKPVHSAVESDLESLFSAGHYNIPPTRKRSCTYTNCGLFSKTSPLLSLSQDLVELVSGRFGFLGCVQREDSPANHVPSLLAQDDISTMLEDDIETEPLPEYSDHHLCQMIELWMLQHPLSFLVSKTLFLHSYRNKTHDPILLAVILGGACLALGGANTVRGHSFFHWAHIHFRRRYAGSPSISTIQVIILLGWYKQCCLDARRASCYVYLARMALKDFQHRCDETPATNVDWINGIDVGRVELELCQRMYCSPLRWTCGLPCIRMFHLTYRRCPTKRLYYHPWRKKIP